MILGRKYELNKLEDNYRKATSSLIVIYGRRRIGKSHLIAEYGKNKTFWSFEALENTTSPAQMKHFQEQLSKYIHDELLLQIRFLNWNQIFRYLTEKIKGQKNKTVIFFDELQWMAAGQSKLISLIKYYWDNEWKNINVQLILCGSIASFMVDRVIKSKALYGRIDLELLIRELSPHDLYKLFKNRRSQEECLNYILLFGGVPKYFELIDTHRSLDKNIQDLCFEEAGYLFNEYEKIFYGHFKEYTTYEKIVKLLSTGPKSFSDISKTLKMSPGGGLKKYLKNLEMARFIRAYTPVTREKTNIIKYKLFDEYIIFYFKYIKPLQKTVKSRPNSTVFTLQVKPKWQPWLGIAFENFCMKYNYIISKILEIDSSVIDVGPYFQKEDQGFQIDLLFKRADKTWTMCECKYQEKPVGPEVIIEVERKAKLFKLDQGYSLEKVLIAPNGANKVLKDSDYFSKIITLEDLFTDV